MLLRLMTFILFVTMVSCSSGEQEITGNKVIAFLPYVISIDTPEMIYAGSEFELTMTLSSQATPELLSGLPVEMEEVSPYSTTCGLAASVITESNSENQTTYYINPWIVAPPMEGVTNNQISYSMTIYQPGEYAINVYSTHTPESGGTKTERSAPYLLQSPFYIEEAEYQEYTITVLLAENAVE